MVNPGSVRNGSNVQALDRILFPHLTYLRKQAHIKQNVTCLLHTYYHSKPTSRAVSEKTT